MLYIFESAHKSVRLLCGLHTPRHCEFLLWYVAVNRTERSVIRMIIIHCALCLLMCVFVYVFCVCASVLWLLCKSAATFVRIYPKHAQQTIE